MRKIKYIAIHCTAGFTLIPAIENFWYKSLKWKSPGYHIIVYENGELWFVTKNGSYSKDQSKLDLNKITNGIGGFNSETVHISYVGGVERGNTSKANDSRTAQQKSAIIKAIGIVQDLLKEEDQDVSKVKIQGHRDFSPDKNGSGVIESWERIKECPSFDAIPEYKNLIPKSFFNYKYTLVNLNLRTGRGTSFASNGNPIPKGGAVIVLNTLDGWSKVEVVNDKRIGFVSSKYLR